MNNMERLFHDNNHNIKGFIKAYTSYLCSLLEAFDIDAVAACIQQLDEARQNGNTIFLIGNGGSASTASHIANDFGLAVLKNTRNVSAKSYRALALTDNLSVISAIGNDSTFDNIFLDQLRVHYRKGDKLIAISASGNSPNLIAAAEWFKQQGGTVIGWLGFDGGKLLDIVDIPIVIRTPKGEYAPVEDMHLVINHIIVTWLQCSVKKEENTL